MKRLAVLLIALGLVGCTTTREVVVDAPRVSLPATPTYPLETPVVQTEGVKAQFLAASFTMCLGYIQELKETFKPYTK